MPDLKPRTIRVTDHARESLARHMTSQPDQLARAVNDGRAWLAESGIVAQSGDMLPTEVIQYVQACYPGGWPEFIYSTDAPHVRNPDVIWLLMTEQHGLDFTNRIHWTQC